MEVVLLIAFILFLTVGSLLTIATVINKHVKETRALVREQTRSNVIKTLELLIANETDENVRKGYIKELRTQYNILLIY